MTVLDPSVIECPECGSDEMSAEVQINYTITGDGQGGIANIDPNLDSFGAFERMTCAMCDHPFILDGRIVDDRISGTEVE